MPAAGQYATVKQIVASHHRDLGRLQRQATDRQRRIVQDAFLGVKKEIAAMGFQDAATATWTQAHRMAVMSMVDDAYRKVYAHGQGAFIDDVSGTSLAAQQNMAVFLTTLDKKHHGVIAALRFDTLQWWDQTNEAIGRVRLREYQQSFVRYGAQSVRKIEDAIGAATLQQKTWRQMRTDVWKAIGGTVEAEQYVVDRIIRTELSAAYNGTTLAALHEEDRPEDRMLKRLVATFDRRTGKDSILLHGQTRKLEEPFYDAVRARYYQAPPNRPNDRETVVGWRESYGELLDDPYDDESRMQVQVPLRAPELAAGPPPALLMKPVTPSAGEMTLAQAAKAIGLPRHTLHHAHLGGHLKTTLKIPAGKAKAIPTVTSDDLESFRQFYLSKHFGIGGPVSPPPPLVAPPLPKPKPVVPSLPKPTEVVLGLDAPAALVQRGGGSVFSMGGEVYVYRGETLHKGVRWIDTDRGLIQIPNEGKVKLYSVDDAAKLKPSVKGPPLTELAVDEIEVGDLWLEMLPGTKVDKWRYPISIEKIEELAEGKRKIHLADGSARTVSGKEWVRKKADHLAYRKEVEDLFPVGNTIEDSLELGELDFDLVEIPTFTGEEFDKHLKLGKWMSDHYGVDLDLTNYDWDLARQIAQRVASRAKRFQYMRSQVEIKTSKFKPGSATSAATNRDFGSIEFNRDIGTMADWATKWEADGIKDWGLYAKKPTPWSVSKHVDKNMKAAITADHEIGHNLQYGVWRAAAQGDGLATYVREEWTALIARHAENPAQFVAGLSEYAGSGWLSGSVNGAELWAESMAAIWNGQAARVPLEARRLLHLAMRMNDDALKMAKAKQGVKLTTAEKKLPAKPPKKVPAAAEPIEPKVALEPTEKVDVFELDPLTKDVYDLNEAKKAVDVPYGSIQGAVKSGKLPATAKPKLDKNGVPMVGHKTGEPLMIYEIKADDLKAYAQAYHAQKGKALKWKGEKLPEPPKPAAAPPKPAPPAPAAPPPPPAPPTPPTPAPTTLTKAVYDLNDVKKEFGIPYGTVQGAVKSGKLPAKSIPKLDKSGKQMIGHKTGEPLFTYEIKAEDLEAWLKEKKPSALGAAPKPVAPKPKPAPKPGALTDVQVGDWVEVDDDDVASMFGVSKGTKLQVTKVTKFESGSVDLQFSNGKSWNVLDPDDPAFFKKVPAPKKPPAPVKPIPDAPKPSPIVAEPAALEGEVGDLWDSFGPGDTIITDAGTFTIKKVGQAGDLLTDKGLINLDPEDGVFLYKKGAKLPTSPASGVLQGNVKDLWDQLEVGDHLDWGNGSMFVSKLEGSKAWGQLVGVGGPDIPIGKWDLDFVKITKGAPKVPPPPAPVSGLSLTQSTYSVAEAKKATGIPYGSIVSGLKSGKLPGTEIAGKWVIKKADLDDWASKKLAAKAVKAPAAAPAPAPVAAPKPAPLAKGQVVEGPLEDLWANVEPGDWIDTGPSLIKVVKVDAKTGSFEGFSHSGATAKPKGFKAYELNKKSSVHLIKDGTLVDETMSATDLQIVAAQQKKIVKAIKAGAEPPPTFAPPPKLPTAADIDLKDTIDVSKWQNVGPQRGSNPGGLYRAPDGQEWYVKTPTGRADKYKEATGEELVRNEVLAAELYRAAGIEVPEVAIAVREGKVSIASKIIPDLKSDAALLKKGIPGVYDGFAVDAWLGNWDVVGASFDNLLIKGGKAIRVDTGGALRFRAQGGPKGDAFGDVVTELDSLRNPGTNAQSAAVFGNMKDEDLISSIDRVLAIDDNAVKKLVEHYGPKDDAARAELHRKLIARKNDLAKKREELVKGMAAKKEAARLEEIARKEAAERIRKMKEEGKIPLQGKSWDRIHAEKQDKIIDSFFRSTEALAKSKLGQPGYQAFKPESFLDNGVARNAAAVSRTAFEKTYPPWMHEIWRDASGSWSSSSIGGSADLFHACAIRFGLTKRDFVTTRGKTMGRMRVGRYEINLDTGDVSDYGNIVGNIDDAFAAYYGHTQAVLQSQGITKVRAYRGVNGQLSRDLEGAVRGKTGARQHIVVSDPGASWSDSPMSARGFSSKIRTEDGTTESHHTILTREADVAEVIADRRASPYSIGLGEENEYILAGDNRRVVAYAEVEDMGVEHQGLGDHRHSFKAILFEVENAGDKTTSVAAAMASLDRAATPILPVPRPRLREAQKKIPKKAK